MPKSLICTKQIMVVGYKYLADQNVGTKEAEELLEQAVQKLIRKMPTWNKVDKQTLVSIPFVFVLQ